MKLICEKDKIKIEAENDIEEVYLQKLFEDFPKIRISSTDVYDDFYSSMTTIKIQ